ncbi:FAD-dependent oxidoreductase [Verrucomicrobiota bacterium]
MLRIEIDGRETEVEPGATILDACRQLGIKIPTMCFLDGYEPYTSCMICVVRDVKTGKFVASCTARVADGMMMDTLGPEVQEARRAAIELLLGDHLGDCEGPCQRTCPASMNIPLMIRQIAAGEFADALVTVKKHIPLPAVLGRICPAPCEKACRREQVDDAVSICNLKRYVADVDLALGEPHTPGCRPDTGRKVAIVGAGPAGLSTAYYLRQYGHACTIIDDQEKPGGALRTKVPENELPRDVLDSEVEIVRGLGVEFRMSTCVGKDVTMAELKSGYDAVVLAVGPIPAPDEASYGVDTAKRGIKVDSATNMTSDAMVFAGGAAVSGGRMAVKAVGDGKRIAFSVNQMLGGAEVTGIPRRFNSMLGKIRAEEAPEFMKDVEPDMRTPLDIGAPEGFSEEDARKESARCLHCDCRKPESCKLREYSDEYGAKQNHYRGPERQDFENIRQHADVIYEPGKCISCGICVHITRKECEPLGLSFIGRGFSARVGVPFDDSLADALRKTAKLCVESCPTGALSSTSGDEETWK